MRGIVMVMALAGCTSGGVGLESLGKNTALTSDSRVQVDVVLNASNGLNRPTDLAFNPEVDGELWVVNAIDDSVVILNDAHSGGASEWLLDPYALHFLDAPTSIDFGAPGTWGSCHESTNTYNGQGAPNYFMGPTLWSSDREIFAKSNPEAVEYLTELFGFPTDLGSHLDMLHESPLCMGITWEDTVTTNGGGVSNANVYWVWDGFNGHIVRYDFQVDHGVGYDDHSDGIISRYDVGALDYVAGVPAHMDIDENTKTLYYADPAEGRIRALDMTSGRRGAQLNGWEPGTDHHMMDGADVWDFVPAGTLDTPSGLALYGDRMYVGDHGTGIIHIFDLDGKETAQLDTGLGKNKLMGLEIVSEFEIWYTSGEGNEVIRAMMSAE